MRLASLLALAALLALPAQAQLSGTYSVYGAAPDYADLAAAVADLNAVGVSGAVTFELAAGTHTIAGPETIAAVTGASAANRVTFTSATGNAADVTLQTNGTSTATNGLFVLDGADYVTVRDLTLEALGSIYSQLVTLTGQVDGVEIRDNVFLGAASEINSTANDRAAIYAASLSGDGLTIDGNTITGFSYGALLTGLSTSRPTGIAVTTNAMTVGRTALRIGTVAGPTVEDNTLAGAQFGVYVVGATVDGTAGQATRVVGNRASGTTYPIWLSNADGVSGTEAEVVNNLATGSTNDAIYVTNSDHVRLWHNTAVAEGTGRALLISGGTDTDVRNNVLVADDGDVVRITPGAGFTSDHNLYYTTSAYLGRVSNVSYLDLAAFSAALSTAAGTTTGANSVFADPAFTDAGAGDYAPRSHFAIEQGAALGVADDLDGTARPTPAATAPDLGAVETGAPAPAFAPLAGTYAVPGDFATLDAAAEALALRGAAGAVTFSLAAGSYTGQAEIAPWAGASPANRLTVTSATATAADVTLDYEAASSGDNYVVLVDGARHVTLQHLTLDGGSGSNNTTLLFGGGPRDVDVMDNVLTSASSTSSSTTRALVRATGSLSEADDLTFSGNTFSGGGWGIYLTASSIVRATNVVVDGNTFDAGYGGVRLDNTAGPLVTGNTITGGTYGVFLNNGGGDGARVTQNRTTGGTYGLFIQGLDATAGSEAEASNNVAIGGANGLYVSGSDSWRIWNNTAILPDGNGQALFLSGGADLDVRGNVLWANGGEAYGTSPSALTGFTSDWNALYTTGSVLGRVANVLYPDLASFSAALDAQTGVTTGINSLFADPIFADPLAGDVTPDAPALDATAAPVLVAEDVDGTARSTVTPTDLGAVAFATSRAPLAAGTYAIPGDFATLADAVDALRAGITGAVTFEFATGTYAERATILPVTGASAAARVTFTSATGDAADVTLSPAAPTGADDNHVFRLESADYVTIDALTLTSQGTGAQRRAIALSGGPDAFVLSDAVLSADPTLSQPQSHALLSSDGTLADAVGLSVSGTTFTGGGTGIYVTSASTTGRRLSGVVVEDNTFDVGRTGVRIDQSAGSIVRRNAITAPNWGVYLNGGDGDGVLITRNRIVAAARGIGISNVDATSGSEAELSNNVIEAVTTGGIDLSSADHWRVWHNTAVTTGNSTAFAISSGTGVDVRANVFAADAGRAYDASGTLTSFTSDWNALYTAGSDLGRVSNVGYTDLASFASALGTLAGTSTSANSVFADPSFVDAPGGDYTPTAPLLDATAAPALVTVDVDGTVRSGVTPTDLGAIAFGTTATPLAGTYAVGTGGDYATLAEAAAALGAGVSAPVTFELADETFTDRVVISPITGASATNTVTFTAASGATPVLTPPEATGSADNYVIRLDGADWVTISDLTFEPAGTTYERGVLLAGALDGVTIADNTFTGDGSSGGNSDNRAAIDSDFNIEGDGLAVTGNSITGMGRGIDLRASTSARGTNLVVSGNTAETASSGLDIRGFDAPTVAENTVAAGSGFAVYLASLTGASRVERNRVDATTFGIYVTGSDTPGGDEARLANNMVSASFSTSRPLTLTTSDGWQVWHNTAVVASGSAGSAAFEITNSDRADVQNNVFASLISNGFAYSAPSATLADFVSGSNALLSGGDIGRVSGTDYPTLAGFVAALDALDASGTEGTGTFRLDDGYFLDPATADLHTRAGALDGAGVDLGLAVDFDGQSRPAGGALPDVGADEVDLAVACATTTDGAWTATNTALWDCGIVPGTTTDVTVGNAVTVAAGGTPAGTLTVTGSATLDAGARLSVYDRLTPTGTVDASAGELRLEGDADGPAVLDAGYTGTFTHEWPLAGDEGWRQLGTPADGAVFSDLNDDLHTQGAPWATFSFGDAMLYDWNAATQDYAVAGSAGDGPFEPGRGYFVYGFATPPTDFVLPATVDLSGAEPDLSTPLVRSWTEDGSGTYEMVANPTAGVLDWNAVYANAGTSNVTPVIWSYRPGGYLTYNAVSGIGNGINRAVQPFQAFWVQGDGTVGTAAVAIEADDRDNALTPAVYDRQAAPRTLALALTGEGMTAPTAIAVFDDRAADVADPLDAAWLEPIGTAWAAAYFVDENERALIFDARPDVNRALDLAVAATAAGSYTLSWPDLSAFAEDLPLTLVDHEAGETIDLRAEPSYTFEVATAAEARAMTGPTVARTADASEPRFSVVVGTGATARAGEVPEVFALAAPFPNPSPAGATLAFDVPEPSDVTVDVVDLLGRRVAVLAAGPHAPGRHRAEIAAGDLASGVYIVRMQAGSFVAAEKLTVVR